MQCGRNRWAYAALTAVVIIAGLASRSSLATYLPAFLASYAGDTLWALTVFLCLGFVFRPLRPWRVALAAIAIAFSVEVSQLYQADWINAIRSYRLAALLLGKGFKWSDMACYTTGVAMGLAVSGGLKPVQYGRFEMRVLRLIFF